MPEGASIYKIVQVKLMPDTFMFYVEHPDLPEVVEGNFPVEVMPELVVDYDKRPETWLEFDWGLPDTE